MSEDTPKPSLRARLFPLLRAALRLPGQLARVAAPLWRRALSSAARATVRGLVLVALGAALLTFLSFFVGNALLDGRVAAACRAERLIYEGRGSSPLGEPGIEIWVNHNSTSSPLADALWVDGQYPAFAPELPSGSTRSYRVFVRAGPDSLPREVLHVEARPVRAALETTGVAPDVEWLVLESGGQRFAYYLRDGDVTRRLRNGDGASQVLATAEATDLWATPHGDAFLYPSGGRLFEVRDGSAPVDLGPYAQSRLQGVHAPEATQLALLDGTTLRVFRTDTAESSELDSDVRRGSVGYDGRGERLLYLTASDSTGRADALRASAVRDLATETLATEVTGWWAVPDADAVLYRGADGSLRRR